MILRIKSSISTKIKSFSSIDKIDEIEKNRLILEKSCGYRFLSIDRYNRCMSINMILSIDNDLSIGFPISDFIDWSGRNMAKDHGNSLFGLISAISLVELYTYRFVLNRFLSYLLLYCSCSTLFLNCSLLLYFFLAGWFVRLENNNCTPNSRTF